jgi:hypothetical protein
VDAVAAVAVMVVATAITPETNGSFNLFIAFK